MDNQSKATMALGVATAASEVHLLEDMDRMGDHDTVYEIRSKLRGKGQPTTFYELAVMISNLYREQSIGWVEQKGFMSMVGAHMIQMGVPQQRVNALAQIVNETVTAQSSAQEPTHSVDLTTKPKMPIWKSWWFWIIVVWLLPVTLKVAYQALH